MHRGFITLHRKFIDWEWYDDNNTKILFLHCLLNANHKDKKHRGTLVKKGSFLTGRDKLAAETSLSVQQIRTALNKLKSTNEITTKTTNKGTIITIVKWEDYQDYTPTSNQPSNFQYNQQVTNEQPTSNQQVTTTNNDNNDNNDNNKEKINKKESYGEFQNVFLKTDEVRKLEEKFVDYLKRIETLSAYKASTGKRYKSDYATILNWARKDNKNESTEELPEWATRGRI